MQDAKTEEFNFVDGGRVFTCRAEASRTTHAEAWWWFRVSTERSPQRYAPFRQMADDTPSSVQARIVAYYDDLLARRALPATGHRWHRERPVAAGASVAAPATPSGLGPLDSDVDVSRA